MSKKKIKFLHISYLFHPEMGYDINQFARFLKPDAEMIILASDKLDLWNITSSEIAEKDRAFEIKYGVKIIRLPSFKTSSKKAGVFLKGINSTIDAMNPDIIFYHGIESPTYFYSVWKQCGKRYIAADTHTLFSQFSGISLFGNIYLKLFFMPILVRKMVKNNCPVFFTAKENKKVLQWFGFKENRIFNNEICSDTDLFKYTPVDPHQLIQGLLPNGKIILYTGKFDDFKQPELIVKAVRLIENKIDFSLNLVFVGPENKHYTNEKLMIPFSNQNIKVIVLPPVANQSLHQYYSAADIAIFPKQNSLSCLDAQSCGIPVVMEEDATNMERLAKGGICYEKGNLKDLAEKLLELLINESLRKKLSEEGAAFIKKNFSYGKKMEEIQDWLIADYKQFKQNKQVAN